MIKSVLTILTFVSAMLFPWPFTALLAIAASFFEPLIPLAAGLFADTLYYASSVEIIPLFTLYGAIVSVVAFFVRSRIKASIIKG